MKPTIILFAVLAQLNFCPVYTQLWWPDLGNGNYKNPVLFADYSDPDIIRVEDDFYMVASSFNCMPGIPVLHSRDLINWEIINHVYDSLPLEKYNKPEHGSGSWAPSIRYHNKTYYVYFCTPYDGLFMATATDPSGKWELNHIVKVDNWEDPCPFWDDDGKAYLVRSKLCGGALYIHKLSTDGHQVLDTGIEIYRDPAQPTIEGPKFLKKDGYYYIFAPAGGVPSGWQCVLRSRNIYGPYETKVVLHTGNTEVNGPHQGGIVELNSGEWWFMHFQDRGSYGRVVHLQPVIWNDGWPLIGIDSNFDGIGEPVLIHRKPDVGKDYPLVIPQTSDEFNDQTLGLQWQWHANFDDTWYSLTSNAGELRLNSVNTITQRGNFWFVPNLLLQKFPAPEFTVTTKVESYIHQEGERCGLVIMGTDWAYIAMEESMDTLFIRTYKGTYERCDDATEMTGSVPASSNTCQFRVAVDATGMCQFSYSFDAIIFYRLGESFLSKKGKWIGAKVGLFCVNPNITQSNSYATFDWFRFE
jgi:beta-xylosidase